MPACNLVLSGGRPDASAAISGTRRVLGTSLRRRPGGCRLGSWVREARNRLVGRSKAADSQVT